MRGIIGFFALAFVAMVGASTTNAAPIVYGVNESFGGGSITGTITTDGTLGLITTNSPFLAWNLTLNDGTNSSILSSSNSTLYSSNFRFTATLSSLTFDHTFGSYFLFYENNFVGYWCLEGANNGCSGYPRTSNFNVNVNNFRAGQVTSGILTESVFGVANSSGVPAPGALALLGLGLLGVSATRRKSA